MKSVWEGEGEECAGVKQGGSSRGQCVRAAYENQERVLS